MPESSLKYQTNLCGDDNGPTVPSIAIKTSEIIDDDDGLSELDEYASSFESCRWDHYSFAPKKSLDVITPTCTSPAPDDFTARAAISRPVSPITRSATPTENYTPSLRRRRRPEPRIYLEAPSHHSSSHYTPSHYTPSLTSASCSDSEAELPPPSPRPRDSHPRLRRMASSLSIAAATANFVVLKPSAFLVAMMFSIAARIATRAVAGAAYSLAERGDLGLGWDEWNDTHGEVPANGERAERRRRRRSEIEERRAWGLEE